MQTAPGVAGEANEQIPLGHDVSHGDEICVPILLSVSIYFSSVTKL